ncbi:MAG TPA: histidine kinase [Candidatus Acidoferrum sp.]|nr:histidine kinase [Candidatus Acidoferrum sp.]
MPNTHELLLVNIIGHAAGAIIFGIFLVLLIRDRAGMGLRAHWRSLAAAGLAFLWNTCSLAVLAATIRFGYEPQMFVAFTFSVLSLLPAVLFDLSLGSSLRTLVRVGYILSSAAVILHFVSALGFSARARTTAFLLITVGFALLTVIALTGLTLQHETKGRPKRIAGAMCSALFAISFVHFNSAEPAGAWSNEIALHHAGLPLALFVLLQDYRFLLLDAFTRFLANVLLAAVLTFAAFRATSRLLLSHPGAANNPLYQAALPIGLCLLLIAFALLRSALQKWLTKVVFRRPDLDRILRELQSGPALLLPEAEYISWAAGQIAEFMGAQRAQVLAELPRARDKESVFPMAVADVPSVRREPGLEWVEVVVPVRLGPGEMRYIILGRRRGGRRYLSEDLQALSRQATAIAEQVDRVRTSQMEQLVTQAELRALQSQMNPHFLFNALNALYGIIPREAAGARRMVTNLAQVFRYFLHTDRALIPLQDEMEIVKAYLEIESLRLGPRMHTDIQIDDAALSVLIPVLSIQPLVENAVRHGLAPSPKEGCLRLRAEARDHFVDITVEDTGEGMASHRSKRVNAGAGVGLANVKQRLKLCYGPQADLGIDSNAEGTTVRFTVPRALAAKAV